MIPVAIDIVLDERAKRAWIGLDEAEQRLELYLYHTLQWDPPDSHLYQSISSIVCSSSTAAPLPLNMTEVWLTMIANMPKSQLALVSV